VIGSAANIRRLAEIQDGLAKLSDPRKTSDAEAARLSGSLPVVVWLAYGVHGNEISSPDAGLMTAYHLLAARNDKTIDAILAKAVVIIDPLQNPDGRNRFVHSFEVARATRSGSTSSDSATSLAIRMTLSIPVTAIAGPYISAPSP